MTKNRKVKQTNITSQEELKKIVLQKVHDLLKRSTTNLTYSRIKAALEEKYGHLLVSSIKSEIQDILQSFAEDHDRRNRLEPAAEDKDAKPDDDFAAMFETTVLHTKIPQSDTEADDDSNNSDSECNDDAPQTPQKPRSPPNNTGPHTSPLSTPKDPKLLHLELQNWETEMQKLDQNDENDMMLRQMLQKKIDVIQETLSKSGDLLGKKSSSYLSNFDAKFSKLKIQAEKSVICEGERACTCCGRPLFAGAKVPEGCAYQDDLGTELKPKPSPVVITSLPRTDNRQSSGLLSSREDEDMFEL